MLWVSDLLSMKFCQGMRTISLTEIDCQDDNKDVNNQDLAVNFKDFCVSSLFEKHPEYKVLEANKDLWENAVLLPQGSGVYFNDDLDLTVEEIWRDGKPAGKAAVEPRYAIAYAISSAREEKGLSQKQLSLLSGVSQCDISRIEGGVANPTVETISKLCSVLGLEMHLSKTIA